MTAQRDIRAGTLSLDEDVDILAERLERRFRRRVMVVAAARLADPGASEDVAQETLTRVLEALRAGRVENLKALPAFVYQTARHVCQQRQRKSRREGRALGRLASEPTSWSRSHLPLERLIEEERRAQVRAALDRLKEEDRALLRLFFYEGLDRKTIAARLNVSDGALRVRRHRALQRLSELLDER